MSLPQTLEYVPIPVRIALAGPELATEKHYYVLLRTLAWSHSFDQTDPMPVEQLWGWLGVKRRQFYKLLKRLKDLQWIATTNNRDGSITIHFVTAGVHTEYTLKELSKLVSLNTVGTEDIRSLTNLKGPGSALSSAPAVHSRQPPLVEMALQRLKKSGVVPALAQQLLVELPAEKILDRCEIFDWAYAQKIARGPGYLVQSLRGDWEPPFGYLPPGHVCKICKRSKVDHEAGCRGVFGPGYDPYAEKPPLEDLCRTCGADLEVDGHFPDCWRALVDDRSNQTAEEPEDIEHG